MKINNGISPHHTSLLISSKGVLIVAFLVALSIIQSHSVFAQLVRHPHPRNNISTVSKSKTEVARKKGVSLSLPFWDDFSFTPVNDTSNAESNVPLTSLWYRGRKVWINDGIGINPPTINVATFDGLDSLGLSYSDAVLATGFRDTLESQPIDLAEVIGADTNTVFLSFFYQWQGNGEPPDPADYMRLEFKNDVGEWVNMMTINTRSSFDKTVFYDTIIQVRNDQVNGNRFFHDAFQFRLKNYGRLSGPFDTWNIDYIYLNKGRTINDNSFPDQGVASTISPLFGKYSAMPIKHFFASSNIDSVKFDITNLLNRLISVSYAGVVTTTNYENSVITINTDTLVKSVIGTSGLMNPFERYREQFKKLPDPDNNLQFNPDADSIDIELSAFIGSQGALPGDLAPFAPIQFTINDTISTNYRLDNYYAYDDGVAEYSTTLTHAGNKIAYQFTRPSTIPDSLAVLNGIDIYFPDFGVVNSPTVDLTVYDNDGGKPGNVLYTLPNYQIKKMGMNRFQFVEIRELLLVGPTYYVGWKQPISGTVIVGLDASNNTRDKMIVYSNGQWDVNEAVEGSLMLRPHFGKANIMGIEDQQESLQVFPNPSKGEFHIKGKYDRMEIITVTGQSISFTSLPEDDGSRISIPNPSSGLYILKIVRGNTLQTRKIVID